MPKMTATAEMSSPDPLVETKPGRADDIFLSPHIVDETAFHDFAQRLRTLVETAESAAQSLRGSVLEASAVQEQMLQRTEEQTRQLSAAAKVLRALDAVRRSLPAERPSAPSQPESIDSEPALARAQRQIHVSVESALKELDRRAGAIVRSIEERQVRLEARLDALTRKEEGISEMLRQIEATAHREQAQARSLVALHCRTSDAIEKLESMLQSASATGDSEAASSDDASA